MKLKPASLVVLAWTVAAAACSPLNQTTYWKHIDNGSTASATAPQAALDQDITACTNALSDMPATDPHDFDGCMLGEGWERQNAAPDTRPAAAVPPPAQFLKADNSPQNTPPAAQQQAALTEDEKQQVAGIAQGVRQGELVPVGGQVSLGLQGYQDRYNESTPGVNIHTNYAGAVAGYTHRSGEHNFWTIDGRVAHGEESYNSPSGLVDDVPEYEGEARLTVGKDYSLDSGWISPYAGLGTRFFRGDGKGHFTSLGKFDYDRRIEQLYVPLGGIWRTLLPGQVTLANTLEVDPLLIGSVNSRLQNGGGPNLVNTQSLLTGFGVRGEMMFGIPLENQTVEFGPFFRYWNINDSTFNIQSCMGALCQVDYEPYNTRLQLGLTTRVSF